MINKKEGLLNEKIETERLILIPISMEYKNQIFDEFTSEITTYMFPAPAKDISETEGFINESIKGLADGSNLQLVAVKKDNKEFIGCFGLHGIDTSTPEMGLWLKKSAHGNGYGKEAMTGIKEWADANLSYEYILYPVADKNIPSRKIPESFGAKIHSESDKIGLGGNKYHALEYRIYKKQ